MLKCEPHWISSIFGFGFIDQLLPMTFNGAFSQQEH
jgi:hypothetical protein